MITRESAAGPDEDTKDRSVTAITWEKIKASARARLPGSGSCGISMGEKTALTQGSPEHRARCEKRVKSLFLAGLLTVLLHFGTATSCHFNDCSRFSAQLGEKMLYSVPYPQVFNSIFPIKFASASSHYSYVWFCLQTMSLLIPY